MAVCGFFWETVTAFLLRSIGFLLKLISVLSIVLITIAAALMPETWDIRYPIILTVIAVSVGFIGIFVDEIAEFDIRHACEMILSFPRGALYIGFLIIESSGVVWLIKHNIWDTDGLYVSMGIGLCIVVAPRLWLFFTRSTSLEKQLSHELSDEEKKEIAKTVKENNNRESEHEWERERERKRKEEQKYWDEINYNIIDSRKRKEQEDEDKERKEEAKRLNEQSRKLFGNDDDSK